MGKVKSPSQGAKKKTPAPSSRATPRTAAAVTEEPAATPASTVPRRQLAATSGLKPTPPSVKRPPSVGRKLSALSSSQKRRGDSEGPGPLSANRNSNKKPLTSTPQPETASTPEGSNPLMKPGAPAMTVAEAQELGEQARLRDETMWALEGLSADSIPSQQESLVALLEIYANRRNRIAFQSGKLANELFTALGKLKVSDDLILALGAAAVLHLATQFGGDPMIFARDDIAKLTASIIEASFVYNYAYLVHTSLPENGHSAPAARILRLLTDPTAARVLPREAAHFPASVALSALSSALDPNSCPAEIDKIKDILRTAGVLKAVAQLAADNSQALVDPSPTMETVTSLWQLERSLVVLEHSCFACTSNEAHLIAMEITQGVPPMISRKSLSLWLVQQVQNINRQAIIASLKKDCLRGLLAVLMNMTHNNEAGCAKVVSVNGLETVSAVLARICFGSSRSRGIIENSPELKVWLDELNGCLGVLINCSDAKMDNRTGIRGLELNSNSNSSASGSQPTPTTMIALLSQLISTVGAESNRAAAQGTTSHAEEVTLDALQSGEGEAAASIVEVYAAILLGFLVEGDREAQKEAAEMLPGKSMVPVISAVQRCLNFYVTAGALTQRTEASLRALLASLLADNP